MLTRWERQSDWMLDADEVVVRSDIREGVGVRLRVRTRVFQVPAFVEPMEVTAWDPPRSLTIAHGGPVRGRGTWLSGAGRWRHAVHLDRGDRACRAHPRQANGSGSTHRCCVS